MSRECFRRTSRECSRISMITCNRILSLEVGRIPLRMSLSSRSRQSMSISLSKGERALISMPFYDYYLLV